MEEPYVLILIIHLVAFSGHISSQIARNSPTQFTAFCIEFNNFYASEPHINERTTTRSKSASIPRPHPLPNSFRNCKNLRRARTVEQSNLHRRTIHEFICQPQHLNHHLHCHWNWHPHPHCTHYHDFLVNIQKVNTPHARIILPFTILSNRCSNNFQKSFTISRPNMMRGVPMKLRQRIAQERLKTTNTPIHQNSIRNQISKKKFPLRLIFLFHH